jgi:hypothetical protein
MMTCSRAALYGTPGSAPAAIFAVGVAAMAAVATDTTRKATEVARMAPERTSARAIPRPAANQAIWPRTAKPTLLRTLPCPRLPPLPRQN